MGRGCHGPSLLWAEMSRNRSFWPLNVTCHAICAFVVVYANKAKQKAKSCRHTCNELVICNHSPIGMIGLVVTGL